MESPYKKGHGGFKEHGEDLKSGFGLCARLFGLELLFRLSKVFGGIAMRDHPLINILSCLIVQGTEETAIFIHTGEGSEKNVIIFS